MPSKAVKALPVKALLASENELNSVIRTLPDSMLVSVVDSLNQLEKSTGVSLITDVYGTGKRVIYESESRDELLDVVRTGWWKGRLEDRRSRPRTGR